MEGSRKKKNRHESHDNRGSNSSTSETKKKKLTKLERLLQEVEDADRIMRTAKQTLTEQTKKGISKMELAEFKKAFENAKKESEHITSVATAARIAQRKANEKAALKLALSRIEENRERNEEEATKKTKRPTSVIKTEEQKALEREFEEKEAEKANTRAKLKAILNAERIKHETRKLRINAIASKTRVKRKNVEGLLNNVNALELELDPEETAHIMTLAHEARVDVKDVLALIGSRLVYGSEKNAIAFLKFVQKQELDIEALIKELEKKKIPFEDIVVLLQNIPRQRNLSEAEIVYVLNLAHMADVPVIIALDLFDEESIKAPLTKNQRIHLMRVAYLSRTPIKSLLNPINTLIHQENISNAEDQLRQIKENGKTFRQFIYEKLEKTIRNLEEGRVRTKANRNAKAAENRTKLINTLNNENKTRKVERPTYKSIAARRVEEVKDTYTGLKVNNLPIKELLIRTKKDIQDIADVLRGCFRGGIFGKKKGTPEIKTIYIPVNKATQNPKGYAFIEYQTHDAAKEALDYMKNPDTKKPTYGATGIEIKGKDVAPSYGEEFFKYAIEDD